MKDLTVGELIFIVIVGGILIEFLSFWGILVTLIFVSFALS